ncbi:MAG: hypothetical protein LBL17_00600 [Coxiellaceae bacterium]|nr:hypothetical protein [Coxiellaceae bacterium]
MRRDILDIQATFQQQVKQEVRAGTTNQDKIVNDYLVSIHQCLVVPIARNEISILLKQIKTNYTNKSSLQHLRSY